MREIEIILTRQEIRSIVRVGISFLRKFKKIPGNSLLEKELKCFLGSHTSIRLQLFNLGANIILEEKVNEK